MEILQFVFSDGNHFFGCVFLLVVLFWGIALVVEAARGNA
jgi:hypothetical protein